MNIRLEPTKSLGHWILTQRPKNISDFSTNNEISFILDLDKNPQYYLRLLKNQWVKDQRDLYSLTYFLKEWLISKQEFIISLNIFFDTNKQKFLDFYHKNKKNIHKYPNELLVLISIYPEEFKKLDVKKFKTTNFDITKNNDYLLEMIDYLDSEEEFSLYYQKLVYKIYQDMLFWEVVNNVFFKDIDIYWLLLNILEKND